MDFSDYIRKLRAQTLAQQLIAEQSNVANKLGNTFLNQSMLTPGEITLANQSYSTGNYASENSNVVGSYQFLDDAITYVNVCNSPIFNIGSNPFTIDWFQFFQPNINQNPRIFSIGNDSSASTINFSYKANASPAYSATSFSPILTTATKKFYFGDFGGTSNNHMNISSLVNKWAYCALEGNGSNLLNFYINGNKFGSTIDTNVSNVFNCNAPTSRYNIVNDSVTNPYLTIGSEYTQVADTSLRGNITNFRYTVGQALYVSTFSTLTISTPITTLTALAGTTLLLLANSNKPYVDSGPASNIVSSNGAVTWLPLTPFPYLSNVQYSSV